MASYRPANHEQRKRSASELPLRCSMLLLPFTAALLSACAEPGPAPPTLRIDPQRMTVSGISSGAYMAHQVHLAFSTRIAGAGLIAGGPYACAADDLTHALEQCMQTRDGGPDAAALAGVARTRAASGSIDPLAGLDGDRVWIFHGDADYTVASAVTAAIAPLYRELSDSLQIEALTRPDVAHVFPTLAAGGDCAKTAAPFVGNCGFDAAGAIFSTVVGVAGTPAEQAQGELISFDQNRLSAKGVDSSLADQGYLYVPRQCRDSVCGLHIVFHGCQQSAETIGTQFIDSTGYPRWADLANVVLIYPQTRSSLMPLNPKACWDWWGYSGADYDTRKGAQIAWVGRLLDHFGVRTR